MIHTIIFFYMLMCLFYILYAGIKGSLNWILVPALSSIALEGVVFFANRRHCPLTRLAEKYGAENGSVTDIFLPSVIARNTVSIATAILITGILLLAGRFILQV